MKVVIISGGQPPAKSLLEEVISEDATIICADSGANILYEYKIIPHYLVGDFDSIKPEVLKHFQSLKVRIDTYPINKDDTDSEIALNKAFELGASEIVFLGCTGSRLDHIFGNIGLLKRCLDENVKAEIKDDFNTIFLIDKSTILYGEYGKTFSLQCFNGMVKNLNIKDAKYLLNNYNLVVGDPITISNMFLNTPVNIMFEDGLLLVFYTND